MHHKTAHVLRLIVLRKDTVTRPNTQRSRWVTLAVPPSRSAWLLVGTSQKIFSEPVKRMTFLPATQPAARGHSHRLEMQHLSTITAHRGVNRGGLQRDEAQRVRVRKRAFVGFTVWTRRQDVGLAYES
ncbi:hypothetical protein HJFPF1_08032 [Paramyrothecium foliicola]|nr:hypothetical protein HJFPF1_08032 [Paramyrothecium foliicola]